MTIIEIQNALRETIRSTARSQFEVELEMIAAETPPTTELGDVAFPIAFELAKKIKQATGEKKNPREIAETLKSALESIDFVAKVEVAGAGYLNIFFDRAHFLSENAAAEPLPSLVVSATPDAIKVCVEHTSVNPNKAAHIGHVRNSVLGDTFQRDSESHRKTCRSAELYRQYRRPGRRCCCGFSVHPKHGLSRYKGFR